MRASADPGLVKRLSVFASAASLFSIAIGLSVLAGWTLGVAILITWGLGTPMAPNAAGCSVLAGISLWLRRKHNQQSTRTDRVAAQGSAIIVAVVGLVTLAEHIFRLSFGIDRVLLVGPLPPPLANARILMSPIAAGNFLLFGLALLLIDWRTRRDDWPAQFFSLGASVAPAFGLLGLLVGPKVTPITLALPAVVSYFLLTPGLICSRATWALGGLLTGQNSGARLLRRATPAALIALSLIGWFISKPLLTESHFTWVEASLLGILCGATLIAFVTWIAFIVERSEALSAELERRVAERTAALGESEARLTGIIHSAMDAILTIDQEQIIVMFNAAAEKMFGCSAHDAVGQSLERFIPQRFRIAHRAHIRRFSETGITNRALGPASTNQLCAVRSNGEEFPIEASISQVETDGKKLFTVILRDITERTQAEDALRESEERFRALVMASSDVVYRMSPDWSEMRQLGGKNFLADTEAPNRNWLQEYIHPDDQARVTAAINKAIRTKGVFELEHHVLRVDGSLGWTFSRAIPLQDANGEIVEWFGAASDVTERKRAEDALHEGERRYRLLFSEMVVGFALLEVIYDEEGRPCDQRYLEVNPAFETHTGLAREKVLGKTIREALPDIEPFWIETYGKIATSGESAHFENYAQPLQKWFEVTAFRTHQGQVAVTFSDITQRKRMEEALRDSEVRFQALANGIPQLAWMAEADGHIFWYNQRWYEYTGTTFEQMEGWAWQSVHDSDVLPKVLEKWKGAIAAGLPFDMEFPLRGADGVFRAFLTRVMPSKDSQGRVLRWFGTNTDISERKEAEKQLATQAKELSRKAEELARSNADLEQFAYVASHDLQEPLRMVTAYTQLLGERYRGKLDADADKFIGYASEGAQRMQVLIQDLLAFSRVGRRDVASSSVDCNAVMQGVVETLSSVIEGSGAVVTWETLPAVWANRTQMAQLFQNLVGNAVKFRGQERPMISVRAEKADLHWLFSVSDNGIGIPPESAEQIFVVFQRLHARTEYPGNGIGLAICKKIVERCGGRIWVESQPGAGSTFKFSMALRGSDEYGSDEREGVHDEIRTPVAVGG